MVSIRVRVTDRTPLFAVAPLKLHVSQQEEMKEGIGCMNILSRQFLAKPLHKKVHKYADSLPFSMTNGPECAKKCF